MSVLGIDIGNENCVVATINKGAIQVVRNDLSERLTPALVAFTEKERLIGDGALTKLKSNYQNTCRNIKNLIGKIRDRMDPQDIELLEAYGEMVPCEYGYVGYEVNYKNEKVVFSAARILASLLQHLINIAEKFIGKECKEIVLSYPPMFTNCQKECLLAATKIINVNALRIISDNTAVALDYGMYRMKEFSETEGSIQAFVNIGYANTCVSIVKFFSNKCEILCDLGDGNLGGRNLDNEMIKYIANLFTNAHKFNPLYKGQTPELCELGNGRIDKFLKGSNCEINNKIRIKLEEVAVKTKKVLSANNDASIHVECLFEDLDCQGSIDRATFEEMVSSFFISKLKTLLDKAVIISGVNLQDINSVEILGGTTRIPFVQNCLQQYFGLPLSKTLIADESIARGCVLSAAMFSKHYKVKEYECIERITHPISVEWYSDKDPQAVKREKLYTRDCPKKRQQKIVIPERGTIRLRAYYENTPELPHNCLRELQSCIIKIPEKQDKVSEARVMTHFTNHDTFTFIGAETVTKTVIKPKEKKEEEKKDEKEKAEGTQKEESTTGAGEPTAAASASAATTTPTGKEGETKESQEKEKEPENNNNNPPPAELKRGEEGKIQTCYQSIPIEIVLAPGTYTKKEIVNFTDAELNMQQFDKMEGERLKNRNELETIIYETRSRLNEQYKEFVIDEERDALLSYLDTAEDWLYDNEDANKNVFCKKKEEIREKIKDIVYRYDVYNSKLQNTENIISHLNNIMGKCESKPSPESQAIVEKAKELIMYIKTMQEKEQGRKLYEMPLFTLSDIEEKFNSVNQQAKNYIQKLENERLAQKKKEEKERREREERERKEKEEKEKEKQDGKGEQNEVHETNEEGMPNGAEGANEKNVNDGSGKGSDDVETQA